MQDLNEVANCDLMSFIMDMQGSMTRDLLDITPNNNCTTL